MHAESWEITREARQAPEVASCHSNASPVFSQLHAYIHNSIDLTLNMDYFFKFNSPFWPVTSLVPTSFPLAVVPA